MSTSYGWEDLKEFRSGAIAAQVRKESMVITGKPAVVHPWPCGLRTTMDAPVNQNHTNVFVQDWFLACLS